MFSKNQNQFRTSKSWLFIFFIGSTMLLAACFPTKKRPSSPVKNPPTAEFPYGKMDTVDFKNDTKTKPIPSPDGSTQPNGDDGKTVAEPGKTYRIALLLPFLSDKFVDSTNAKLPKNSSIALQFYSGAKLALEKLSHETDVHFVVDVLDSKASDADFQTVLKNPVLKKADVILGGFRGSHVAALADFGKLNGKIIVSPDIASPNLAKKNSEFLQLSPSLKSHCEAMLRFALKNHDASQIVLVCKEKERERLAFFQSASPNQLAEIVQPDADDQFKTDLRPYFKTGKATVFLVPHWSSQDFLNSFFQKVKAQRGKSAVEIYGLPQWRDFENLEADDLEALHVHLTAARFPQFSNAETEQFRADFFKNTGTIPSDDAFNGFDATLFVGHALKKYGASFSKKLAAAQPRGLAERFEFQKVGATDDRFEVLDYWENRAVQILTFENYRFVLAN